MSIFKAYDVRGIYGTELTEKEAYKIGFYLAKSLNLSEIKVGHDVRLSSETLTKYLIKGLLDANCSVTYLGLVSTPNFYYTLFEGINNGIMVTASHNPREYNGFKFIINSISFDSRNGLYNLEKLVREDLFEMDEHFVDLKLETVQLSDFLVKENISLEFRKKVKENYLNFLVELYENLFLEVEKEQLVNLNFSIDFSSGMSSIIVKDFFDKIGIDFNYYGEILDGTFPNHSPDPLKAESYLKEIKNSSDFSFVFDGDGDRVLMYDENNVVVLADYTIALLIDYFSSLNEKEFVCDLRASKILTEMCSKKEVNLKLMRVGRAFYSDYMKEKDCVFGAELSGHMFFRNFNYLDNPDIAMLFFLKIICLEKLKDKSFRFSEFILKYKRYYKLKEICVKVSDLDASINNVLNRYKENLVLDLDGYSFEFNDFWFNIRKSNTESVLKINFEGMSENIVKKKFEELNKVILN